MLSNLCHGAIDGILLTRINLSNIKPIRLYLGFKLVAMKLCAPGRAHMERHYADLAKKPFFRDLVDYMISGPICAMVWEGLNAVKMGRMMLGETNPQVCMCNLIYLLRMELEFLSLLEFLEEYQAPLL